MSIFWYLTAPKEVYAYYIKSLYSSMQNMLKSIDTILKPAKVPVSVAISSLQIVL